MPTDLVLNKHKQIQNMGIDVMAKYFAEELKVCHKSVPVCPVCTSCYSCWKEFLQRSDN